MKWAWTMLLSILILVTAVEVAGYFLPDRLDVEREAVIDAPIDDVWRVVSDLQGWDDWSPILADREGTDVTSEMLGTTAGKGAQMIVRFGDQLAVLFTVVEFDAPTRLALNSRSGGLEDDLLAGDGFEGWDELDLEDRGNGSTRVRWRRTSAEIESYWMRVVDALASEPHVVAQLDAGLIALAEAVGAPAPEPVDPRAGADGS